MSHAQIRSRLCRSILPLAAAALAACGSSGGDGPAAPGSDPLATPKNRLAQQAFESCDAFRTYFADALAEEYLTGYAYGYGCFGCGPAIAEGGDDLGGADGAPVASPEPSAPPQRDVTDTNTQVSGVDEADLIETDPDSTDIYFVSRDRGELLVIDTADPASPAVRARIDLDSERRVRGMYLDAVNDRLAILFEAGYVYLDAPAVTGIAADAVIAPPPNFADGTEVRFFDVSDPAAPTAIGRYRNDGLLVDSRRIDDRIHLVTQFGFPYPAALQQNAAFQDLVYDDYPRALRNGDTAEQERLAREIRGRITAAVEAMPIADLLPEERVGDAPGQTLACTSVQRADVDTRLGMLMITSIDTDGGRPATLGTINNAWTVYGSRDNLYLLQTSGGWWFDRDQQQQTAIYRYAIGTGSAVPGPVGLADGWIDDPYQLDEHEGHLRVAAIETRYNDAGERTERNNLMVLDVASMDEVGALRNFLPDKPRDTIRSARFLGDRGYVVTFEQIDPLVAFDLSSPANPVLAGQLDIPGFSSYIYPLGSDYLLTIGRSAGDGGIGTGNGFQLRLFDVTNLAAPTALADETPALLANEYAYSLAEYEPLAFTFLADGDDARSGLLSIPAQISAPDSTRALSGFMAYRIDPAQGVDGIDEYARIDHKDVPADGGDRCPPQRDELPPDGCGAFAPVRYNEPLRSAIAREGETTTLFTFSSAKLKVLDASDATASERATLRLD